MTICIFQTDLLLLFVVLYRIGSGVVDLEDVGPLVEVVQPVEVVAARLEEGGEVGGKGVEGGRDTGAHFTHTVPQQIYTHTQI